MTAQEAQKKIKSGAKAKKVPAEEVRRFLTIQGIEESEDVTTKDVFVEEWDGGGWVQIRSLTKDELDKILDAVKTGGEAEETDQAELQRLLWLASVKQPRFDDVSYEMLKEKSAAPYMKILTAVMEHSGLKGVAGKTELEKKFRS